MSLYQYTQPQRWDVFRYWAEGGTNGWETQSIRPEDYIIKIKEFRLHFTPSNLSFTSVEDLVIYISSASGSAYNILLLSLALSGITDFIGYYNSDMWIGSQDQIIAIASMKSAVWTWGFEAIGWAVRG